MADRAIPVNIPKFWGKEKDALLGCIESGWISSEGPQVKEFEEALASKCGRKFGVACANGSAALDIAWQALGLQPGDEVIMPTFCIISCITEIVKRGATPVLVDCGGSHSTPSTSSTNDGSNVKQCEIFNMVVDKVGERITSKTKAVLAVHTYEYACDMDPLVDLCEEKGLILVEDAAEMIGQQYKGKMCGSFGLLSTFSFYPNKHITTGEGGMVMTDSPELNETARNLRNLCFDPRKRRFIHDDISFNYRMTCMQASLGLAQLAFLDEAVRRKRSIGVLYNKLFREAGVEEKFPIRLPFEQCTATLQQNIFWVYMLEILSDPRNEKGINAETMMKELAPKKVGTRPAFYPMHLQPVFTDPKNRYFQKHFGGKFENAERLADMSFYLPSGLGMSDDDIQLVVTRVTELCKELFGA